MQIENEINDLEQFVNQMQNKIVALKQNDLKGIKKVAKQHKTNDTKFTKGLDINMSSSADNEFEAF